MRSPRRMTSCIRSSSSCGLSSRIRTRSLEGADRVACRDFRSSKGGGASSGTRRDAHSALAQSKVDKFGEIANAMRKTWHLLKSQTAMKQIVFDNPGTGSTLESHLQLPYIRYGLSAKVKKLNCSLCGSPRGSAPTRTDSKGLRPDDAVLLLQRDVSV